MLIQISLDGAFGRLLKFFAHDLVVGYLAVGRKI